MKTLHITALSLLTTAAALGAPQYGTWGFDSAGMDIATKAGDDFFRYANGAWLDKTPIPADKPAISFRLQMTDRAEARIHDLLDAAKDSVPTDVEGKAGRFYRSFMDEARIEAAQAKPLAPLLTDVRNAKTREELARLMGRAKFDLNASLFKVSVDVDLKNPNSYALYINQGGLGLPDRDYYLRPEYAASKLQYESYVASLLKLEGWPADQARAIVEFETGIARASWTKAEQRDPVRTYNPMSVLELGKLAPGFDWKGLLAGAKLSKVMRVVVSEKSAFSKLSAVFAATPIETLRAWQAFRVADNAAPYLSKSFADAWFGMHDKTLSGQKQQKLRWKRAVLAVSGGDFLVGDHFGTFGTMGWGVGQLYVAKYFPLAAKAEIEALVTNLKTAYRVRLEHLDWMSDTTRKEALKKLDTYAVKVGYPDHPRDYAPLIVDDDILGNVRRAAALDWAFYSGRLFGPVDKSDWMMTPQTNNAYNGSLRDIVFPAGILQAPVFDQDADSALNYGAVGGIIGHELTHGFDDEGRKIDASGTLRDWWTPKDSEKFETRAKALGAEYSALEPLPGVHVNGDLTMGENIADLGGLTLALDAYHASLGGRPAPIVAGLTGDQRVLLGWAQAWRGKVTDEFLKRQVVSDPHSPRQFRVNGVVRNIDAWYKAFGVKYGEKLYVEPKKRVRIW